jgi:signal transduction histidine kinase
MAAKDRSFTVEHQPQLSSGLERLTAGGIYVVLLDILLPDSDVDSTISRIVAEAPHVPVVVLTALDDLELGTRAVQQGAQDYLVKTEMSGELLTRSIRYAIERKRSRRELEHYTEELERSNREFEEFARVVSHDLKSPLSVVSFSCALLRSLWEAKLDKDSGGALNHIDNAVRLMSQLIDDLLDYARVGSGEWKIEPVECESILQRAVDALAPSVQQTDARVTHDPLPQVTAEPTQLFRLFLNLLDNAIKYRGEAPPRIHLSAENRRGEWLFRLRDNGIGIRPEDAQRVFTVFERVNNDESSGTGIGLAICKRIVELHGGTIWVESEMGKGCTFYFTLPHQPWSKTPLEFSTMRLPAGSSDGTARATRQPVG